MCSAIQPSFLALVGSDTQSEALLAEQNVAAVSGVYGDDGVVFRELADPALLRVNVALAVQTANPVVAVAENVHDLLTDSGHDGHVENNIDGVCQLNADLSERGTDRAHGVRDNVHGTALVAAIEQYRTASCMLPAALSSGWSGLRPLLFWSR